MPRKQTLTELATHYAEFSLSIGFNDKKEGMNGTTWRTGKIYEDAMREILRVTLGEEHNLAAANLDFFLDEVVSARKRAWNIVNAKRKKQRTFEAFQKEFKAQAKVAVDAFTKEVFKDD